MLVFSAVCPSSNGSSNFQARAQLGNTRPPQEKELDLLITAAVDTILRAPPPGTNEGTKIMAKRVLDQSTGTRLAPPREGTCVKWDSD